MSLRAIVEMSSSPSLMDRVAAAMATLGIHNPREVLISRQQAIAATPGWAGVWQMAVDNYDINQNPDFGARTDVITDEMILDGLDLLGYRKVVEEAPSPMDDVPPMDRPLIEDA